MLMLFFFRELEISILHQHQDTMSRVGIVFSKNWFSVEDYCLLNIFLDKCKQDCSIVRLLIIVANPGPVEHTLTYCARPSH